MVSRDIGFFQTVSRGIFGSREAMSITQMEMDVFLVRLDYRLPWEEWLAWPAFDWSSSTITPETFPITGCGIVEERVAVLHANREVKAPAVREYRKRKGLLPIRFEHMLALAAHDQSRDLQRRFPIVNIDSECTGLDDVRHHPFLLGSFRFRDLRLAKNTSPWSRRTRFLALLP